MNEANVLDEIIRLIAKINRRVRQAEKQIGKSLGLSPSQVKVIMNIDEKLPLTHSLLSKKCHFSKSTLSEVLDAMEKKEIIKRVRCNRDKRKVYVNLTPKGSSLKNNLVIYHNYRKICENLSMTDLEKKLLYILLKKFYNQIS